MATAGGGHQHGIEWWIDLVAREALHQGACQISGLFHLALVMAHRTATALIGGDHDFVAIGLEHSHGGRIDCRVKTALNAAKH